MRLIARELVDRWEHALAELTHLDVADGASATIRALDDGASAREHHGLPTRGPLAAFGRYLEVSNELEFFLASQDPADPAVARARSAGAYADLEAAGMALRLALTADTTMSRSLLTTSRALPSLDEAQIGELAHTLRGAHDIRGGSTELAHWTEQLHVDLQRVTDDASARLIALDASTIGDQAADGFGTCLSTLLDDGVLGKLIEASSHAISFLHRCALELAHAALRKAAGFCDDDVKKALAEWFARGVDEPPAHVVADASGADLAMDSWSQWATAGVDVAAHLVAVGMSRDEHLQHLAWAHRSAGVAALVYATSLAAPPTVPFAVFFGGVALVGLAAWMLWSAGDHCREVADLV